MAVSRTRKGETSPKLSSLLKNKLFVVLDKGASFSTRICLSVEQRFETAL